MDDGAQRENGHNRFDFYKEGHNPWNIIPSECHMMRSSKSERSIAIEERNRAVSEKEAAIRERDLAIQERDAAIAERNDAIRERDNAIAALRFQESTMNTFLRAHNHQRRPSSHVNKSSKITKETRPHNGSLSRSKKQKKVGPLEEDLNKNVVTTDGSKAEWDAQQQLGLMEQISFDETTMPIPICSCTGVARQCYKWGSGGWQSSCCTTTLSVYPLPQMPNKRHSRLGGRKMSGSVFTRLLTRLASQGYHLSAPVDLKNYWAKHGTNRYITIK